MLNLYKSNKIEVISELLAEELKICPPPINEKLQIVVPNFFFGNWLREQITIKNKISALYELKTISTYTKYLLIQFLSGNDSLKLFNSSNESIIPHLIDSKFHALISIAGKKFVNKDSVKVDIVFNS